MGASGKLEKVKRDRILAQARTPRVQERICRISLASNFSRPEEITWCEGLHKPVNLYILEPGSSITWPLSRAESYFGPFQYFKRFEETHDEKEAQALEQRISEEMARYLNRYDCPRGDGRGESPNMQPTGAHNSPDVTIEILAPNGGVEQTCRLYELYGTDEFNKQWAHKKPTVEETKAYYEEKLAAERSEREKERQAFEKRFASLEGKFDGALKGTVAGLRAAQATK